MNALMIVIVCFSLVGAIDVIIGNRLGLGNEFEQGILMMGPMMLSVVGMIVIAPVIANFMKPMVYAMENYLSMDASIVPAILFANDMGGAPLALELAGDEQIGMYNALVISSMMGCTVSFTIPVALGMVNKEQHRDLLLGFLAGIITIPVGSIVAGVLCGISLTNLCRNLIFLIVFSAVLSAGLVKRPQKCVDLFLKMGRFIKILVTVGLALGIVKFLTGIELIEGLGTIEEGVIICGNAIMVLTGAFPMMHVLSQLLKKPLKKLRSILKMNEVSSMGLLSTLVASITTYGNMDKMDRRGVIINAAFCVSATSVFADHLAYTMSFNAGYVGYVIIAKLISGIAAICVAVKVADRVI